MILFRSTNRTSFARLNSSTTIQDVMVAAKATKRPRIGLRGSPPDKKGKISAACANGRCRHCSKMDCPCPCGHGMGGGVQV